MTGSSAQLNEITDERIPGFEFVRKIGAGGMGTVYEARQLSLDRRVAIKVLSSDDLADPSAVERFRREAKAAAEIDHDNVVRIFDYGTTEGGTPYCIMELLVGRNLAQVLKDDGPLPWPRMRNLVLQMADALEAAHRRGVIHRDMKPANCIVWSLPDGRERLKVLDFGIAKFEDASRSAAKPLTMPGTVVGSATYMSPEQFVEGKADARSDIYALGIMIHELLAGEPPFTGKNPLEVGAKHVRSQAPRLSKLRPELSEGVSEFVLRCIAKKVEDRFADMAELRAALLVLPGDHDSLQLDSGARPLLSSPLAAPLASSAASRPAASEVEVPPTEVLDTLEPGAIEDAGSQTETLAPPTGFITGFADVDPTLDDLERSRADRPTLEESDEEAPRRRARRTNFEAPLEAESDGRGWLVIAAVVAVAAVAAAILLLG